MNRRRGILVAVCLCLATVLLPVTEGKTITVTNANDNGAGSLRQAILDASPNATIVFDPSLDGQPIPGALSIPTGRVVITGRGPEKTIVRGNVWWSPVFRIGPDATVVMSGMTIKWGTDGGIVNHGTLDLENCYVVDNVGGGVSCPPGPGDSPIPGPFNGGIANYGTLTLEYSIVARNMQPFYVGWPCGWVPGKGGGIANFGTLTVNTSSVIRNQARLSDGIYNEGSMTVTHSTIAENGGAGIGNVTNGSSVLLIHSTVSGNGDGPFSGGAGIANGGSATIEHSTVSGHEGVHAAGISNFGGTLTISNSMIADNRNGSGARDCFQYEGSVISQGHNLDSDGTCNLDQPTDLPNTTDPMISPLADNGGSTSTHALLEGSPAIDAGSCRGRPTDQRGVRCPVDITDVPNVDDGCDIGAYEYTPPLLPDVRAVEALHNLILALTGEDHDLVAPLQDAIHILEDAAPDNNDQAIDRMLTFIAEVEERRGSTFTNERAHELIAEAQRIIDLLMLQ